MSRVPSLKVPSVLLALAMCASTASAQPAVRAVSGNFVHKGVVTITGTRFGTKPAGAPVVWDDSSGTTLQKWSGGWPDCSASPFNNIAVRAPIRGIAPPHQRVGRYIAGAHAEELGFCGGQNVMLYKTFTAVTKPLQIYASWYQRADDNWVFGLGDPADDNYKEIDWTTDRSPYGAVGFYVTYNPSATSRTTAPSWAASPGMGRDVTAWGDPGTNPMAGAWTKVEAIFRFSAAGDGRIQIIDNGVITVDYTGITDNSTDTIRTLGIGGYSRGRNPNNWRYFTDVYVDTSWARVMLGNAPTLAASTRRELQVPVSWSDTSISVTGNLAAFNEGETAYLYVFDANGNVNATGFPVGLGGTLTRKPAPPTNVRIVR